VDPKHPFKPYGRSAFSRLGVEGFDKRNKKLPWYDLLHFGEEFLSLRCPSVFFEGMCISKGLLSLHERLNSAGKGFMQ
jgi:hypothetical protein